MPDQGQTLQLISTLAGMQSKRRELDLEEQRIEEMKHQFAVGQGFAEKSDQYKKFMDLADKFSGSAAESQGALAEVAQLLGHSPERVQALMHLGQTSPKSLQTLQAIAANRGYFNANPQQQGQMNLEAASTGMTGMNQGQMGQSTVGAAMANPTAVTPQMQQGFAQRMSTGQNPMEAFIGQMIQNNPNMARKMAGVMAGTDMSAAQQANADVGAGGVAAQFAGVRERANESDQDIAVKLATAKATGGMTPQLQMEGFGKALQYHQAISNPKASDEDRTQAMAEYNRLIVMMGYPELQWTASSHPSAASLATRMQNAIAPSAPPPPQAGALPMPVIPPVSQNNSLTPFLNARPQP